MSQRAYDIRHPHQTVAEVLQHALAAQFGRRTVVPIGNLACHQFHSQQRREQQPVEQPDEKEENQEKDETIDQEQVPQPLRARPVTPHGRQCAIEVAAQ